MISGVLAEILVGVLTGVITGVLAGLLTGEDGPERLVFCSPQLRSLLARRPPASRENVADRFAPCYCAHAFFLVRSIMRIWSDTLSEFDRLISPILANAPQNKPCCCPF